MADLDARLGSSQPPSSSPESTGSISPIGPIVMGVGGAALIAGLVLVGVAGAQDADLLERCPDRVGCDESLRQDVEATRSLAVAGDILWIAGAVVAVGGLVLTFALPSDEQQPVQTAIRGVPGGGLASVSWRLQ